MSWKLLKKIEVDILDVINISGAKEIYIGASAGIDSMVLVHFVNNLRPKNPILENVTILHFDHNLRSSSDSECQFVGSVCNRLGLNFISEKWCLSDSREVISNIESKARKARHKFFNSHLGDDSILLLAHHLDDDIEWNLLCRLKSSNVGASSYINHWDGKIFRPFLEVSKAELIKVSAFNDIKYLEDESNGDTRFERNYLRKAILPKIESRFSNYREHFLFQKYQLTAKLSKQDLRNIIHETSGFVSIDLSTLLDRDYFGKADLFFALYQVILMCFKQFKLSSERGAIGRQILKIITAITNNSKGPLILSGPVYAYVDYNFVHFSTYSNFVLCEGSGDNVDINIISQSFYPFYFHDLRLKNSSCRHFNFVNMPPSLESISIGYITKHFGKLKKHKPCLSLKLIKAKST